MKRLTDEPASPKKTNTPKSLLFTARKMPYSSSTTRYSTTPGPPPREEAQPSAKNKLREHRRHDADQIERPAILACKRGDISPSFPSSPHLDYS